MKWTRLGELMADGTGSVDPSRFPDEVFQLYSIPSYESGAPETRLGADIGSSKQLVLPGDVLLSRIVPHIRRAWVVGDHDRVRIIASGEWIVFRSDQISSRYLRQVLLSDRFHGEFMQTVAGVGGSLLRARPKQVAAIQIPLPALAEQERIASMLDAAEALREKRRRSRERISSLVDGMVDHLFPGLRSGTHNYSARPFVDLLVQPLRNGESPSSTGSHHGRVLTLSAITRGSFDATAVKEARFRTPGTSALVQRETFLICRGNGNRTLVGCGRFPSKTMSDVRYPDTMIAAQVNEDCITREYLEWLWSSSIVRDQLERHARTTNGTFKVNQTALEGIVLPVPPIRIQREFSARVEHVGRIRDASSRSSAAIDALITSLQHRAFRGEL